MDTSKISAYSTPTVVTLKTGCSTVTARTGPPEIDLLDSFRDPKVCEILPTSDQPRPDAFAEFRPPPRTVLDYNISQTELKSQVRQPLGIVKLHVKETSATYKLPPPGYVFPVEEPPPPPPPKQEIKYSTGRGPFKEFFEETWRRKVEIQQAAARKNLKNLIKKNRKYEKEKLARDHAALMKLVGPDWFQELSPKQLKTVDNLKNCIVKDVKLKTTCNTEINMAQLGLVLRPNPRHIKIALKKCCECPVEFLLILYQLLNKHRTDYSLNDRLLLSAVAHLTMRETLKELHIRIPSPPPPLKKEKKVKKEKVHHYKSPYLVPFTFRPEKPKHTGIYKNNHIQYPESPYFSYISELKSEIRNDQIEEVEDDEEEESNNVDDDEGDSKKKLNQSEKKVEEGKKATKIMITKKQSGISDLQEKELVGELKVAQREYNNLVDYEPVPFLHKPSIYIPCDHGLKKKTKDENEEEEGTSTENETNTTVSVEVRVTTDFDAYCQPIKKVCECKITFDETIVPKHPEVEDSSSSSCCCCSEYSESEKKDADADLVLPIKTEQEVEQPVEEPVIEKKSIAVSTASRDEIVPEENIEKSKSILETNEVSKEKVAIPSPSKKVEKEIVGEKLITLGHRDSDECKCKDEVEKLIETRLCQCDRCKEDRKVHEQSEKSTFIISGMQETQYPQGEDEEEVIDVVPVISGVKLKKTCDCLEKYQAKVKMYEEMKKSFDAQHTLKTVEQQYIIGGITHSPEGEPVYMLSGVTPKRECSCAKVYQEKLKEQERLANMPKIPLGRQKYIISGVHETNQGNVFVVSGATATDDCPCMKMYKSYASKHLPCLKMYDEYLKKIEMDTQEYMAEIAADPRFADTESVQVKSEDTAAQPSVTSENIPESSVGSGQRPSQDTAKSAEVSRDISGGFAQSSSFEAQGENNTEEKPTTEQNVSQTDDTICTCGIIEENDICYQDDDTLNISHEISNDSSSKNNKPKNVCICEPGYSTCACDKVDPADCQCGYEEVISESEESEEPLLKRFIILDKIPCEPAKQMEILKKALEVLAEDGFPLAKLPDSHKLPLFKLWMQLRCCKFWRQEDRVPMLMLSCAHWRHIGYCGQKVRLPKLKISPEEARQYNWTQAKAVRKMAEEADVAFYRTVRQANIYDSREFFPSTFSYQFPTPTFRDCYFAYTAGKEEDCVCWRPWYSREVKNFKNRKSCY